MATSRPVVFFVVSLALLGAGGETISPMRKVVEMLDELQTEVVEEGAVEAKTYDKFACWCKDTSIEKTEDITEGQDDVDGFSAEIEQLSTERNEFDQQMDELKQAIDDMSAKIKAAMDKRAQDHASYLKLKKDLEDSQENCEMAGEEIQKKLGGGGGTFLLSVARKSKPLQRVAQMAQALGFQEKHKKLFRMMLQEEPSALSASPSMELSGDEGNDEAAEQLLDTVNDIQGDFGATLDQIERDEFKSIGVHQVITQGLRQQKDKMEKDLAKAKERRDWRHEDIAKCTQELTAATAVLVDDQKYLSDLTDRCNHAAKAWDQRSSARQNELTALTQAMLIIKEKAVGPGNLVRSDLLQEVVAEEHPVLRTLAAATSFLQVSSTLEEKQSGGPREPGSTHRMKHHLRSLHHKDSEVVQKVADFEAHLGSEEQESVESPQAIAIALLKERGSQLGSAVLVHLATQVVSDPFAKVKQLIQELTERLLQEAADEANHKGWCDTELGKNKQKRNMKVEEIRHLNAKLESGEAKRDGLMEKVERLRKEIAELTLRLDAATEERGEESSENMDTVKEAEQGEKAISEAYTVLDRFYKTMAKAELGEVLLSTGLRSVGKAPEEEEEEEELKPGFDSAYKGGEKRSAGILAMLDVIRSDFHRSGKRMIEIEKQAEKDFFKFETDTKMSISTKDITKTNFLEHELVELKSVLIEQKDNMISAQAVLDKALQELAQLHPICVDSGMSYEERVAKREQEIESLKEALCVFDENSC